MAFSSSVSQDITTCQLCEINTNIRYKCLDCNLLLCEKCKDTTHLKFKNAYIHQVVSLKDIQLWPENESNYVEFKPVRCATHTRNICVMYCYKCSLLVCPRCISENHQRHELEEIEKICKQKANELDDVHTFLNSSADEYLQKLKPLRNIENAKYKDLQNQIMQEQTRAMDEVRRTYAAKLYKLQEGHKNVDELITKKEEIIVKAKRDVEKQKQDLQAVFDARDTEKILDNSNSFHGQLDQFSKLTTSNQYKMKTLQFKPGKLSVTTESDIDETEIEITRVGTHKVDLAFIRTMTVDMDCKLWIADDTIINQMNANKVFQKHTVSIGEIMEMKCTKKNEILITIGTEIKRLGKNGKFETVRNFDPVTPATLHISAKNEIVVGMDLRQSTNTNKAAVINVLNVDGTIKDRYFNDEGLLVNDLVRSCTTTENGSTCFIDSNWSTPEGERVVMLGRNGRIKWIYNGTPEINSDLSRFNPIEVLCVKNIIVSDKSAGILHVLSHGGLLLTVVDLTLVGVENPGTMCIDSNGYLWINDNGTIHKFKYSGI